MKQASQDEYLFYIFERTPSSVEQNPLPESLRIRIFSPSWKRYRVNHLTRIWYYWFWYWFSHRKYQIYYVVDHEQIVHVSHVISRNPKFAFMGPEDMEVGPCWTHPDFRGQGIYSSVLARIAEDLSGKVDRLFIFAERNNAVSLKGITKSGFKFFGSGAKKGILGTYRITSLGQEEPIG